jgi:transcriptional regulator with XRE-family HTH domain
LLRAAREASGLTQQELADLVGVTRGTIANAENGASTPRDAVTTKLSEVLDAPPEDLGLPIPNEHPLARVRRAAGDTQQQLADECEVTRRTIIDLEAGRGNPNPVLLGKLTDRYDLAPEDLGFAPTGHPLAAARAAYGLTQQQLAEDVGVHTNVIVNAESGRRSPRPGTVLDLADRFQSTPQALGFSHPEETPRVAARKQEMEYWVPVDRLLVRVAPPKAIPEVREFPSLPPHLAGRGAQAAYLHAALAGFPHGLRAGAAAAARAELPWPAGPTADGPAIVRPDPEAATSAISATPAAFDTRPPASTETPVGHRRASRGAPTGRTRPGKATGRPATPERWLRPPPGSAGLADRTEAVRRRAFPHSPAARQPAAAASAQAHEVFRERFALAVQNGYVRGWALVMARRALDAAQQHSRLAAPGTDTNACRRASAALGRELPFH